MLRESGGIGRREGLKHLWHCRVGSIPISRTILIGNSNFYKFESNKSLTEMLVFLLFNKG